MAILEMINLEIPWGTLKNIVAFVFVLGLLVFIHELGHFTVAKLNKIHVYQFCIGLGPKLIKYKGKETTYAICALPVGGMVDLREDDNDPENLRSFAAKKPWQRLLVIVAGAFMNFVLAYIIIVVIFMQMGSPSESNTLGGVPENMPAYEAGLREGDTIVKIDDQVITTWLDITNVVVQSEISEFDITYVRKGVENTIKIEAYLEQDNKYRIGVTQMYERNFSKDFSYGSKRFISDGKGMIDGFVQLITGKVDANQVSGPVGIYKIVGTVADRNDFSQLMYFAALLSINLGIFNLLPFPFLDGGRAVFIIYEMITRKPIHKDKEAFVHFIGMVALMLLMVVLVVKDLGM